MKVPGTFSALGSTWYFFALAIGAGWQLGGRLRAIRSLLERIRVVFKQMAPDETAKLTDFFQGPWSEFIVALYEGRDAEVEGAILLQTAASISPTLANMMRRLVSTSGRLDDEALITELTQEWRQFQQTYLHPRGFHCILMFGSRKMVMGGLCDISMPLCIEQTGKKSIFCAMERPSKSFTAVRLIAR